MSFDRRKVARLDEALARELGSGIVSGAGA